LALPDARAHYPKALVFGSIFEENHLAVLDPADVLGLLAVIEVAELLSDLLIRLSESDLR
jgi:hypothetical protein